MMVCQNVFEACIIVLSVLALPIDIFIHVYWVPVLTASTCIVGGYVRFDESLP